MHSWLISFIISFDCFNIFFPSDKFISISLEFVYIREVIIILIFPIVYVFFIQSMNSLKFCFYILKIVLVFVYSESDYCYINFPSHISIFTSSPFLIYHIQHWNSFITFSFLNLSFPYWQSPQFPSLSVCYRINFPSHTSVFTSCFFLIYYIQHCNSFIIYFPFWIFLYP